MTNSKIKATFSENILQITFLEDAVVSIDDLKEIYAYGAERSGNKKYGIIFMAVTQYHVTPDAIDYIIDNPENKRLAGKVYVANSKKAADKIRKHLVFDSPTLVPFVCESLEEGMGWLREKLKGN